MFGRNLVNCVNNIAQINTDCGPHPQLSPDGKKHDNHQMSEFYNSMNMIVNRNENINPARSRHDRPWLPPTLRARLPPIIFTFSPTGCCSCCWSQPTPSSVSCDAKAHLAKLLFFPFLLPDHSDNLPSFHSHLAPGGHAGLEVNVDPTLRVNQDQQVNTRMIFDHLYCRLSSKPGQP